MFAAAAAVSLAGCSNLSTVRLQPDTVEVGEGLRPIAGIQASAATGYVLFIPLPGGVDLDRVVNRMLVVAAKTMGADKVADLRFSVTPDGGIWALRKLLGWRSAKATGIAVQITAAPQDASADDGPEVQPAEPAATPGPATPGATSPGATSPETPTTGAP